VFLSLFGIVVWMLWGAGDEHFEHLHLGLDAGNGILAFLLALFLWANLQDDEREMRRYISISFAFTAAADLLHALIGIEWTGWFVWMGSYSSALHSMTWMPATYILPVAMGWMLWLLLHRAGLSAWRFATIVGVSALALLLLALSYPPYEAFYFGIQRPMQLPLILLWAFVIFAYWRHRASHPLFQGLALMGVLFLLSDLPMLYSLDPHDRFSMMGHVGKMFSLTMLHVILMHTAAEDAHARSEAETQLSMEKERLRVMLDSIADGVIATDTRGTITYMNPTAAEMTGWKPGEARGKPLGEVFQIINEHTRQLVPSPLEKALCSGGMRIGRVEHIALLRRDGTEFSIQDSAAPLHNRSGKLLGMVLVFQDVSFARKAVQQLNHQATHDALTGLLNRSEFERHVDAALTAEGRFHTVLFLDLDRFKLVNDTCGHIAGDELLRRVTLLLQTALREGDILARLGGDEFAVLLEGCPIGRGEEIAGKLRMLLSEFRFQWDSKSFNVAASIGLVCFSDNNHSAADIMKAADTACYIAKDMGRNRVHVYSDEDSDTVLRRGEMEWVGRINQALSENRFCLHRQRIAPVSGLEDDCAHYEILVRMLDEQGGLIMPMAFIPAAERYGLMPQIDRWVVREAFKLHVRDSHRDVWSINLSGASLNDDEFLGFLKTQFAESGVAPESVCFEITETAAVSNLTKAGHFIRELRALGCSFSLDDFGSGMSSFGYLKYLPVDYLKIDGSFVKDMVSDAIDCAMVEAVNKIGHLMGLQTIAEFVGNEETRLMLADIGVNHAQGFGIGKPEPF